MGDLLQLRRTVHQDLPPLFERGGSREQKAVQASRALIHAIDRVDPRNLDNVVALRADSRVSVPPTAEALDFAYQAAQVVYPGGEWLELVNAVGNAADRAWRKVPAPPPTSSAVARAAGRELALAIILHDRLPVEVFDSLVSPWQAAFPALAEHPAGVGSKPVSRKEIDMATATRDKAQRGSNAARSAGKPASTQVQPKQATPARGRAVGDEQLNRKVMEYLAAHPRDSFGPWDVVHGLELVAKDAPHSGDRAASRQYDLVKAICDRAVDEGALRVTQPKPRRFQWAGKGASRKRAASAPATASEATTQAAEAQRENPKPQATRDEQAKPRGKGKRDERTQAEKPRAERSGRATDRPMPVASPPPVEPAAVVEPEPPSEPRLEPSSANASAAADDLGTNP